MRTRHWFLVMALMALVTSAWARDGRPVVTPFDTGSMPMILEAMPRDAHSSLDAPGDIVNFQTSLVAAGNYLKRFQADVTEDNAGNGSAGTESPDDPDDAGWDWMLNWNTQAHFHSTAASPTNIYGATAQGLYRAYLATSDATYWTALLDAANHMVAVGDNIRSGADIKFLMLFDALYDSVVSPTSTYVNAAKSKYDNRITAYGSATALAEYIRNARHGQGYDNGIIAWDIGIWAVCAQMLYVRYGGTYDADADAIAEVLYQDSFNDNPGYFDVVDDAGYDPTWVNKNYWWYTIGLTGLIDAFDAAGVHTTEIAGLITRLQASQHSNGAFSDSYGANAGDEDWQDTAYILMTLHNYDATTYATRIRHGAYWLGATQHSGGGWVYGSGNHYPEVGGECTAALSFGSAPSEVWVDDNWHNQADVDAGHPGLVWGYDAFGTIQNGINGVGGSTVNVAAGTYYGQVVVNKSVTLRSASGAAVTTIDGNHATENYYIVSIEADNVILDGFTITNPIYSGTADASGVLTHLGGVKSNIRITNCIIRDIGVPTRDPAYGVFGINSGPVNGLEVDHNTIYNLQQGDADGMAIGVLTWGNSPSEPAENLNIHDNTIYNIYGPGDFVGGIAIGGDSKTAQVTSNYVHDVAGIGLSSSGIVHDAVTFSANSVVNASQWGFRIYGPFGDVLSNNTVTGCGDGVYVGSSATVAPTISGCSLTGNTTWAVNNQSGSTVNASGNWWGSAAPVWASILSGSVDYTPWCGLVGTYTNPGYTPDLSVLWVDDSSPQTGLLGCVQEGVDMAVGSTVHLAPGTYEEQVIIAGKTSVFNLIGSGIGNTTIQSPALLAHSFTINKAILSIEDNTAAVNVSDLTVNGLGRGNGNSRFQGIAFWNSGGSVEDCRVTGVRETPLSGAQHGVGIYAYNNMGGPYTIDVTDVQVDDYQKNAFALNSNNNLTCHLLRATTIGAGPLGLGLPAQNGIQFGWGTGGTMTDCDVSGNFYSASGWAATGILLYLAGNTTVSGGTLSDNQTGLDFANTSGSASGITVNAPTTVGVWVQGVMAENYNGYSRSGERPRTSPFGEEAADGLRTGGGSLDANQSVSFTNLTMTGQDVAQSIGLYLWANFDQLSFSLSNSTIEDWAQGIAVEEAGGEIIGTITGNSVLSNTGWGLWNNTGSLTNVSDNTFGNPAPAVNCEDGQSGNTYDENCYSDYGPSHAGYPDYNISGGGNNVDANPNVNGCSNVDVYASAYIGCATSCPRDTLYYTLDLDSVVDQRIWITLPAGFLADWVDSNYNFSAGATGWDPRFSFGMATKLAGNRVEIHVMFDISQGGSSGNPARYVASLPIKNDAVAHCGHKAVHGDSTYCLLIGPVVVRDLWVASATITVDCEAPTGTLAYEPSAPACEAFGAASQLVGMFKASVFRGDVSCNSPLDSAWLEVNGNYFPFFGANPSGNFSQVFPGSGTLDENTLWGWLNEGCNSLILHFKDVECNESSVTLANVGKDVTKPVLTHSFIQSACYNNESRSPQYGGLLLDTDLDVTASVGSGSCIAQTGTLWFRYGGGAAIYPAPVMGLPVTNYPVNTTESTDLWNWMLTELPSEPSGNYTFWVIAKDCAGNMDSLSFAVCIDLNKPANAFTILDARPTGLGVWLKWAWTYNAAEAVEAKIFRSVYTGDYPLYNAPWRWDNFADDADYEQNFYDASGNWILVATLRDTNLTSLAYNQGAGIHGGPGNAYWYDAGNWDTLGVADNEYRDIYRYVTFVKDVSGNWSQVDPYTATVNADRSTNYWLGDFSMDVENDGNGTISSGAVEGFDLSLFTASYFRGAIGGYDPKCDIGPETGFPAGENAIGKGIPMPDDSVNFFDLVPFSFNFYMTGYQSYVTMPSPVTPRLPANLDAQPVVSVCRTDDKPAEANGGFTVTVALSGNSENAVKGVEAHLTYDPAVLEYVSATLSDASVSEGGQLFAVARPVNGSNRVIGVATAALGPIATLNGDFTLAVLTFRWKAGHEAQTELALDNVRLFDAGGTIIHGAGSVLGVGAEHAVPTRYALYQNYPNPFNPNTQIRFDLKESGDVQLVIYNVMGQEVRTLLSTRMNAGQHAVAWDGTDQHGRTVGSGVYIYRLTAGSFVESRKMLLTR